MRSRKGGRVVTVPCVASEAGEPSYEWLLSLSLSCPYCSCELDTLVPLHPRSHGGARGQRTAWNKGEARG